MKQIFFFLLFLFSGIYFAQNLTGKVVGVKDGDTVEILENQSPVVVRLAHVDAPEKKQAFGTVSKQYLADQIFGKTVQVVGNGKKDRYGRYIGEIYLKNQNINKEMVRAGMAWHYVQYSNDHSYEDLQVEAQRKCRGLWQDPRPVAPWSYRKQRKEEAARKKAAQALQPKKIPVKSR